MKFIDRSDRDIDTDAAWDRLHRLLPANIKDFIILDLGCGSGWFSRWAVNHGAKSVLALDISRNMIEKAERLSSSNEAYKSKIRYRIADMDIYALDIAGNDSYDLVFSSLTLHYLVHLSELVAQLHTVMKLGTLFVFNVEHPVCTSPHTPRVVERKETGEKSWNLSRYYQEGERVVDWLAPGLKKQHRTMTGYMDMFLRGGFDVTGFIEWPPTAEEIVAGKVEEVDQIRPLFLIMSVKKKGKVMCLTV